MSDCLFCNIVQGTESAELVFEDEHCMAFMDIYPLTSGHILLIPKQHSEQLAAQQTTLQQHLFTVAHKVVDAQRRAGYGIKGTHYLLNDGKATNQHIPHVHLHLIPREPKDSLRFARNLLLHFTGIFGFKAKQSELQRVAGNIKQHLE